MGRIPGKLRRGSINPLNRRKAERRQGKEIILSSNPRPTGATFVRTTPSGSKIYGVNKRGIRIDKRQK